MMRQQHSLPLERLDFFVFRWPIIGCSHSIIERTEWGKHASYSCTRSLKSANRHCRIHNTNNSVEKHSLSTRIVRVNKVFATATSVQWRTINLIERRNSSSFHSMFFGDFISHSPPSDRSHPPSVHENAIKSTRTMLKWIIKQCFSFCAFDVLRRRLFSLSALFNVEQFSFGRRPPGKKSIQERLSRPQ